GCLRRPPPPPATSPVSLHDALPISKALHRVACGKRQQQSGGQQEAMDRLSYVSHGIASPSSMTCRQRISEKGGATQGPGGLSGKDRKSTRLNSSHVKSSYAVFCLKT